jgi:hypothetical protein
MIDAGSSKAPPAPPRSHFQTILEK